MGKQENVVDLKVRYVIDQGSANSVQTENSRLTQALTVPVQANRGPAGGVSSSAMGSVMRGSGAAASRQSFDMSPPAARIPQHQSVGAIPATRSSTSFGSSYTPRNRGGSTVSGIDLEALPSPPDLFPNLGRRRFQNSQGQFYSMPPPPALLPPPPGMLPAPPGVPPQGYAYPGTSAMGAVSAFSTGNGNGGGIRPPGYGYPATPGIPPQGPIPPPPGLPTPFGPPNFYNGLPPFAGTQYGAVIGPGGAPIQGPAGAGMNQRQANLSQVAMSSYTGRFMRGGLATLGRYAGEEAAMAEQENLTGRRDPSGQAHATGALVGGLVGAGIGSLFPGFGTFIGAAIGSTAGQHVGGLMVSRQVENVHLQESLQPIAAMSANLAGDVGGFTGMRQRMFSRDASGKFVGRDEALYRNPATEGMGRIADYIGGSSSTAPGGIGKSVGGNLAGSIGALLGGLPGTLLGGMFGGTADRVASGIFGSFFNDPGAAKRIGQKYWRRDGETGKEWEDRYMTPDQMASTAGGAYSSLVEAGINPESMVSIGKGGIELGHAGDAALASANRITRPGAANVDLLRKNALIAIGNKMNRDSSSFIPDKQMMYQWITENAAIRWGKAGEGIMSKQVDPILADLNSTNANIADILTKHGVGATNSYVQATTLIAAQPRVSLQNIMDVSSGIQRDDRSLKMSATVPRGQGARAVNLLQDQQDYVARLPGGTDSLTYAEMGERKRQASFRRDREGDIMSYDLPMASLEGQEQRRQYLPNMPGYGLKLSLQRMGMRAPQIAKRSKRYAAQVASGMLSEEEQLSQYNEIQGMENDQARDIGYLAEGGQDRALAFSGGRPSFFGRMDSISLARSAVWRSGSPQVGMGARDGKHLQYQNDFFRSFDNSAFSALDTMKPHSRTANESGPFQSTGRSEKTLENIRDILQQIAHGGNDRGSVPGGGAKIGERYGNQVDNQDSSSINKPRDRRSGF